jgi:cell division protease FtsH
VSYAAVQNSGFSDTNLVGRVLGDSEGRRRVEELLQRQKVVVRGLLETHAHLVAALRDALVERHELIGTGITDVLEQAMASRPLDRIDLGESSRSDETSQGEQSDGGTATIDLRTDRPAVAED